MHITRRAAIVGTAASFAVARLASATPLPPPVTVSPFLRVYDDHAILRRMVKHRPFKPDAFYDGSNIFESISFFVNASDGIPVASVAEAEDILLGLIPSEWDAMYGSRRDGTTVCQAMNHTCNRIAARTRIGRGDIFLMSRDTFALLAALDNRMTSLESVPEYPQPLAPWRTVGRWTGAGIINYIDSVFVGEHPALRGNRVIVMRERDDNHAVVIRRRGNGALYLVTDPKPIAAQVQAPETWNHVYGKSADFFASVAYDVG